MENEALPTVGKDNFDLLINEAHKEHFSKSKYIWDLKPNENSVFINKILTLNTNEKVCFILDSIKKIHQYNYGKNSYSTDDPEYQLSVILQSFKRYLLKTKLELSDEHISSIYTSFITHKKYYHHSGIFAWPIGLLINQIERQAKGKPVSEHCLALIKEMKIKLAENTYYLNEKEKIKLVEKLDLIAFNSSNTSGKVKPTYFIAEDDFGKFANEFINNSPAEEQNIWFKLVALSHKASGTKPSKKYIEDGTKLYKELGDAKFKKIINSLMEFIVKSKEREIHGVNNYNGIDYPYTAYEFISRTNLDMMKGFVWLCVNFYDKVTLFTIASLAERAYRKIPGVGPAAAGLGNACLYVLSETRGLDGIGHLSRLKLGIKQNNTRKTIDDYLLAAAKNLGITIAEIEELSVDDFDLVNNKKNIEFGEYTAWLEIIANGKTNISWYKKDGNIQKSLPNAVKENYVDKLKKLKSLTKQIEINITAQKNRIDRMFKMDRKLTWDKFDKSYFSHGLISFLAKKLIWSFTENGRTIECIWIDGTWRNNNNEVEHVNSENTIVRLWHPVKSSVIEIKKWRNYLEEKLIQQPIKQAFREIYLLTDAEINTRMYSNRMAAHILKQHQFNSLANLRGWKYSLLGAFDDGRFNEAASISIPESGLKAEFWINEVNAENAHNDTGIWNYISTDQVRFISEPDNETVLLINIPPIVFSEIMRDVDLFVGVASVGNDPTWSDTGGIPAYRDYWQSYSFGDLSEVAKTRKEVLQKLLPKLKIAANALIQEKFLIVKGRIRTYKIHIGSTNILMEPNDEYLCIVPDRSKPANDNLFLPFEGDTALSVIISKAFLLVEDDKITDSTITRQINRK